MHGCAGPFNVTDVCGATRPQAHQARQWCRSAPLITRIRTGIRAHLAPAADPPGLGRQANPRAGTRQSPVAQTGDPSTRQAFSPGQRGSETEHPMEPPGQQQQLLPASGADNQRQRDRRRRRHPPPWTTRNPEKSQCRIINAADKKQHEATISNSCLSALDMHHADQSTLICISYQRSVATRSRSALQQVQINRSDRVMPSRAPG